MAQHLVLMNLAAPLLALIVRKSIPVGAANSLLSATIVQLGLLWAWHAPFLLPHAMHLSILHAAMQTSLFLGALWFWGAVVSAAGASAWRSIVALLTTSKIFCLLGVLLTFAPRSLYGHAASLDDQQLAGLLMLIACPASYLVAAVILAARWLSGLEGRSPAENFHA